MNKYQRIYLCFTVNHIITALAHKHSNTSSQCAIVVAHKSNHLNQGLVKKLQKNINSCDIHYINAYFLENRLAKFLSFLGGDICSKLFKKNWDQENFKFIHKMLVSAEELYVFHDKPAISKLALAHRKACLLEEGASNYIEYSWPKRILGSIGDKFGLSLPLGRSRRITSIYLKQPKSAPQDLSYKCKKLKAIYDKKLFNSLNKIFDTTAINKVIETSKSSCVYIVIGQNLTLAGYSSSQTKLAYNTLFNECRKAGGAIFFKPHPSDNIDYSDLNIHLINRQLPLELLLDSCPVDPVIGVSIIRSSIINVNQKIQWRLVFSNDELVEDLASLPIDKLLLQIQKIKLPTN